MARVTSHESRVKKFNPSAFLTAGVALILVVIPFHAFLAIWGASVFGHYTLIRLWKEFLLTILFTLAVWLVIKNPPLLREMRKSRLFKLIAAYAFVQILLGLAAYLRHDVNKAALGQGLIEDLRLCAMFYTAFVAASYSSWLRQHWQKLLILPAAIVIAFGILQLTALPHNFLAHFGYGPSTIKPYELVDQNSSFVRVQSTLRGANPLGAYLVIIISALATLLISPKFRKRIPKDSIWWFLFVTFSSAVVLYFTYSRSALLGALVSVAVVIWLCIKRVRTKKLLLVVAASGMLVFIGLVLVLRHNVVFEDVVFHTSQQSHSSRSSNEDRTTALENGVRDVVHQPLGNGAGSAGPASVHNNRAPRIAENYFLQIGQEAGWLGLAIFLGIYFLVTKELWNRRNDADGLPVVLLASLVGLTLVNMLSHAWADDTLAYVWWGLAGIALAVSADKKNRVKN